MDGAVVGGDPNVPLRSFDGGGERALMQLDAFRGDAFDHGRGQFGIVVAQCDQALDDGDTATQSPMCLCQFKADRAGTHDDQMLRLRPVGKHRFVGHVRSLVQAGKPGGRMETILSRSRSGGRECDDRLPRLPGEKRSGRIR